MKFSIHNPIHRQIISLVLTIVVILSVLMSVHFSLNISSERIKHQIDNQSARQDVGISIYQRLFTAEVLVFKLHNLDSIRELEVISGRFEDNLKTIRKGLSVLQHGGIFVDQIATNLPDKNNMPLAAYYKKSTDEGYVLEVLELEPALFSLIEQVETFKGLIGQRITQPQLQSLAIQYRIKNLLSAMETNFQRSQENAAGILFDSEKKIEALTAELKKVESDHEFLQVPVISLSLIFAAYSIFITFMRIEQAIRARDEAEQKLQMLLDTTAEGIYGIDRDGVTTFANPAAAKMLGYSADELVNRKNHEQIHHTHADGDAYPVAECRMLKVLDGGEIQTVDDEVFWRKGGESFPVEYTSTPIRLNEEIIGAVVNFRDISQRKLDEKQILTLSQALEQSPVTVIITNPTGEIEYVNGAFERSTGYSAAEVMGKNPRILKSGNTPLIQYKELWQALTSGKSWQGEFENKKKNGEIYQEHALIAPVVDENGITTHLLAVKEDITLQKRQEAKILHQANYDSLTDLPNRFLTLDRLSQIIKEAQRSRKRIAVLFMDLDDFKKINDSMSHEMGDKLLVQAASRLQQSIRDGDTVSRLGGDEFLVLMGNLNSPDDAYPIAEKLLNNFRKTFLLEGRELTVTLSIGIAIYPDDGSNSAELLRNADAALYQSKEQGRNTYNYFTSEMNLGVSRRLQIEEQLQNGLQQDEFELLYQPLVDVSNNKVVAAEALLRWKNPVLGVVSPEEFIPITESTGQIHKIGQFVLNRALAMTAEWLSVDPGFRIAINVSPTQFRDPELFNNIKQSAELARVPLNSIELEITEGVLMSGYTHISDTLNALSEIGVGIALDDFGTGYSSLSYLRVYPFSTLKIDRSFINDITDDKADRELVNAAIAMAHSLGLRVVAEGVETARQLAHLEQQECDFAQGYYLSKPISAKQMGVLIGQQLGI